MRVSYLLITQYELLKSISNFQDVIKYGKISKQIKKTEAIYKSLEPGYQCPGLSYEERGTDDRERIKLNVYFSRDQKLGNDNFPTDDIYEVNYIARPYKKTLGIWYWVASRIINGEINFDLRIMDEQGEWAKFMRTNQTFNTIGSKAEGIFDTTMVYDYNAPSPYSYRFEGIKCVAFQHECKNDSAYIKCNEQIFD